MKRLALAALAVAAALALILVGAPPAGAQVSYNTDWIAARALDNPSIHYTSGMWALSRTTLRKYLVVPDHTLRPCRTCNAYTSHHTYEGSGVNWFDDLGTNPIMRPTAPAYANYDLALIDFGTSTVPATNAAWNYCTAMNCTSYRGGGTQKNPNWAGQLLHVVGATWAGAGWGVMIPKSFSGTSWATIQDARHVIYNGWDYWGFRYTGASGCGFVVGDSGAPVLTGNGPDNLVVVGMHTASSTAGSFVVPGPSPCYGQTETVYVEGLAIVWSDIAAAYPGLSLVPYVGA